MKVTVAACVGLLLVTLPSFGQAPAPTPPIAQLLRGIAVRAPELTRIQNRDSAALSYQVNGSFEVTNNSGYDVKDLAISCALVTRSKFVLATRTVTIYETIQSWRRHASGEITLPGDAPQQTEYVECVPTGADIVGPRAPPPPPSARDLEPWVYRPVASDPATSCDNCPDYAHRFKTSDVDLATELINDPRNPAYLIPRRPDPMPRPLTARDRQRRW